MDHATIKSESLARTFTMHALNAWWVVAAVTTLWAVVAFPFYKAMTLGLMPVAIGICLALVGSSLPQKTLEHLNGIFNHTSPSTWLTFVLLLGLVARVIVTAFPPNPSNDHEIYLQLGRQIVDGKGLGDYILWPPGPPATVALGILLVGDNTHSLAAFYAVLGLATAALFYLGLRRFSESSARWGCFVLALWPSLVLWNGTLGHETTVCLLFVAIALLAMRLTNESAQPAWRTSILIGVVTGIMALVRPTAVAIPFLLALALWMQGQAAKTAIAKAAVVLIVMLAVISPWTMRNYIKYDEFCPISANFGNVLLSANHPLSNGLYYELPKMPNLKPCERDRFELRRAMATIATDPVRFVQLSVKRLAFMWGTDTSGLEYVLGDPPRGGDKTKKSLSFLLQVFWAFLAGAWVITVWHRGDKTERENVNWTFIKLWIALLWIAHAVLEPASRHHLPLIPLIAAIVLPQYWKLAEERTSITQLI